MPYAVTLNDTVFVPQDKLTEKQISITWSENWSDRTQTFYVVPFENKTPDRETGTFLFIQADMLDAFKKLQVADQPAVTFVVNRDFQYGQKEDSTHRWLVFHNKGDKPYQHRFVDNLLTSCGDQAAGAANIIGLGSVASFAGEKLKALFGDYLRDF